MSTSLISIPPTQQSAKTVLHVLKGLDCGGVENFVFNTIQQLSKNKNLQFCVLIVDPFTRIFSTKRFFLSKPKEDAAYVR